MSRRTLVGLWKANVPAGVWIYVPLWFGAIILGLDGRTPPWGTIALFLLTVAVIYSIAEIANTYTDRDEDKIYRPTNPLVTGELSLKTARAAFILQNLLGGALIIALCVVTRSYSLAIVLAAGWAVALFYSVPPLRLKETIFSPLVIALGDALLPLAAWLSVEPSLTAENGFIIAFSIFCFVYTLGAGMTIKFRKTSLALDSGLIKLEKGGSVYNLRIVGLGLKVKTAIVLGAILTLGAFILVPIFWHLGRFDMPLSVGLLTLPLISTVLAMVLQIKDPLNNTTKSLLLMGVAWTTVILLLFGIAVASLIHWGFIILACIFFLIAFILLMSTVEPLGLKNLSSAKRESQS